MAKKRFDPNVIAELAKKEFVDEDTKKSTLASAIYDISHEHPFYHAIFQCMNISYSHSLPTAGVRFNSNGKSWELMLNPYFFCKKLSSVNRVAVLLHELLHIVHKHTIRMPFQKVHNQSARRRLNISMDRSINQYIPNLPSGCDECRGKPKDYECKNEMCPGRCITLEDGNWIDPETNEEHKLIPLMNFEYYYEESLKAIDENESKSGKKKKKKNQGSKGWGAPVDPNGNNDDEDGDEDDGDGEGSPNPSDSMDVHDWDEDGTNEKDKIDATGTLIKRAMIKMSYGYSQLPDHVKELLDELKGKTAHLNYKAMILEAIKKSASGNDRKYTWIRPSKKYGYIAPGTTIGDLPKIHFYIDTSGSISIEEANEFLGIVDEFLKVGSRKCTLKLFHTSMYYNKPYKRGQRFKREDFESGGTDLKDCLKDIIKCKPDLAIFLTDGYYSDVNYEQFLRPGERLPSILYIISKEGDKQHPLIRSGVNTIKIPGGTRD